MADIKALKCPSCGGPLDIPEGSTAIRCSYCGTTLQVGERTANRGQQAIYSELNTQVTDLRKIGEAIRAGNKIEAIKIFRKTFNVDLKEAKDAVERLADGHPVQIGGMRIETQTSSSQYTSVFDPAAVAAAGVGTAAAGSAAGCGVSAVIAMAIGVLVIGAGAAAFLLSDNPLQDALPEEVSVVIEQNIESGFSLPLGYASEVNSYGGEGLNPGQFSDARNIDLDGQGNIYVSDYETGMVTMLNPNGEAIVRWSAVPEGEDGYLLSVAAAPDGTVYTLVSTRIIVYQGNSGEQLGQWTIPGVFNYNDLATTPDGTLVVTYNSSGGVDNLAAFDANGTSRDIALDVIHGLTGDAELQPRLALDGQANIYILGLFNDIVVKLNPVGTLQTRFGSNGSEDGQFTGPTAIAVDSSGRIYVADIWGIQVFSPDGRYLDEFNVSASVRDMAFDNNDNLWIISLDQTVLKYRLNNE